MAKSRANSRRGKGKKNDSDLGGFTIIEVVLVLAIAGLIFLMVFIALPALQRAQRDTQRRDDLAKVSTALTQYQTNNNGRLPGASNHEAETVDADKEGAEIGLYQCKHTSASTTNKSADCLIVDYLNSSNTDFNTFTDPDGWAYGITIESLKAGEEKGLSASDYGAEATHPYMIYIYTNAYCDGEYALHSDNSRSYAVMYRLEGSGTYCQDSGN